jgi:curved DNA-binding protein
MMETEISADSSVEYYEFLQISPNAQPETIHRVYRFLACRFHPDNVETGDREKFLLLNRAYDVLSDPKRRADYDATLRKDQEKPDSLFDSVDFLDGIEGEVNRRLAVLYLLYRRCRADVHSPKVSLLELEAQMGFPREYLDFTTWYLRSKKYITKEDNSDFSLTPLGVDYVESNCSRLPLLRKLLGERAGSTEGTGFDNARESTRPVHTFILGPLEPATNPLNRPD